MPSRAFDNLDRRMKDIDQLMQAHAALTQFKRARQAAEKAGGGLSNIAKVVDSLVSEPGRGRRADVDALNRASIVLLSSHLQGYIEDVYTEAGNVLLASHVKDDQELLDRAKRSFSNPHDFRIDQLFDSIGLPSVMVGLSWQRARNKSIRNRLTENVNLRNRIAHGEQENVTKAKVVAFQKFVEVFAKNFDQRVAKEIRNVTGNKPWQ